MKRPLLLFIPSIVFATAVVVLTQRSKIPTQVSQVASVKQETTEIKIKDATVSAFLAKTHEEQARGLGGRESLGDNEGMLFLFSPAPSRARFWMKDMKFSLDFIWIRDKKVSQIHKNVAYPEPNMLDRDLPFIIPNDLVDAVLEVNAGFTDTHMINVGDAVQFDQ